MKIVLIFLACLALFPLNLLLPNTRIHSTDENPFIYYYSAQDSAFVFQADPYYGQNVGVGRMLWHPTANWLFVASQSVNKYLLNLINIVRGDGTQQRQLGLCPVPLINIRSCFGWLPDVRE